MPKWARKVEKIADAVLRQATNDMINSVPVVPGKTRGGSRKRGTIARDTGALAASMQTSLHGSTSLSQTGEASHVFAVARAKMGDEITITWGGNAAPHARVNHYGNGSLKGTFWIDVMANGWRGYVRGAVIKAKAAIK